MGGIVDKIVEIDERLAGADLPHAFGGALALAWCTERARGTIDIDVNVFVPADRTAQVVDALPDGVAYDADDLGRLERNGQVRLWWDETPVDLFLNTTDFHAAAAQRVRWEPFGERDVPFLACDDLAVFKAFFDRTRDWADLEEMADAGSLAVERVIGVLVEYLGADDHRVGKVRALRP